MATGEWTAAQLTNPEEMAPQHWSLGAEGSFHLLTNDRYEILCGEAVEKQRHSEQNYFQTSATVAWHGSHSLLSCA